MHSKTEISSLSSYWAIGLAWVLFALFSHYFFYQTGDDSYIYFRYIERALNGHWWSWTDYTGAVEGFSSPLWYLLLIAVGKLGFPVIISARVLGLVFAALALHGTWLLARKVALSRTVSGVVCCVLMLNQGMHFWASSGLETSIYISLFVWSCLGIVSEKHWLLPTALLAVARPEGPFLLFAISVALMLFRRHLVTVKNLCYLWLPLLIWLALRWFVYHDFLANTFYAKATGEKLIQIQHGALYSLPVLLPLLACWLGYVVLPKSTHHKAIFVLLGLISMLTGIVLLGGGDWMFFMRLLLPVLALQLIALAFFWQHSGWRYKAVLLVSSLPLIPFMVTPAQLYGALRAEQLAPVYYQEGTMTQQSIQLADRIKQRFGEPIRIAVNHAGALPFALSKADVIDMVGLNDKHIARVEGGLHHKFDMDYVLSLKPDIIVLNSRTKPDTQGIWYHKGYWVGETALVENPVFNQEYQLTDLLTSWQWAIPFPYSLLIGKEHQTSWILVYQRIKP